jgi:hypothetical protein
MLRAPFYKIFILTPFPRRLNDIVLNAERKETL